LAPEKVCWLTIELFFARKMIKNAAEMRAVSQRIAAKNLK